MILYNSMWAWFSKLPCVHSLSVCVWRMAYDSGHSIVGYVRGWQCVGTLTNAGAIVACQLEARLALAGERAGHVNAAVLAVPVPTLIDV